MLLLRMRRDRMSRCKQNDTINPVGALRFYAARLPGGVPGFIVRGRAGTLCLSDPVALRKVP